MSKFNQKALVAAVALGLSLTANAGEIQLNAAAPDAYVHALELTGAAAATSRNASNRDVISYAVKAGDEAVLRAGPIRVTLTPNGATFFSLAAAADQGTIVGGVTINPTTGAASFIIDPPTGNLFGTGALFTIAAGGAQFDGIGGAEGATVGLNVALTDPTTNAALGSASGTVLTIAPATNVAIRPNTQAPLINVGATPARTAFVGGGFVADLGVVAPVLRDHNPTVTGVQAASATGSNIPANTSAGGLFQYAATADVLALTVTAQNGAAFRPLATAPTPPGNNANAAIRYIPAAVAGVPTACASAIGTAFTATTGNTNQYTADVTLSADMIASGIRICAEANGATPIDAQSFTVTAQLELDANGTRDPAPVTGQLATLGYNGTSVRVNHVNPASNIAQVSYLRISNTSGIDGLIRISGRDDAGVAGASTTNVTLGAGKSILLTSAELEQGNAAKGVTGGFGAPSQGKWRVVVDGQIPNMEVQNFLRNNVSGGMINTNVNNED